MCARFLAGAAAMDAETRSRPPGKRRHAARPHVAPCRRRQGLKDMVVLPYKDRLVLFSKYLQQLVMESLGKEHDLDGKVVNQGIAVYGNKGSTDQHAYVQQLRDGVNNFFATFIQVRPRPRQRRIRGRAWLHQRRLPAGLPARHPQGTGRQRPRVHHPRHQLR
jgi:glucose-6-phosphate isomerase